MSITVTIEGDADHIRAEMMRLLGPVAPPVPAFVPSADENSSLAATLLADAKARQEGKNLDGSVRRETTAVEEAATTEAALAKGRGRPKKKKTTLAVITEAGASASTSETTVETVVGVEPVSEAALEAIAETFAGALKAPTPEPTAKEKADAEFAKLFAEKSAEFAAAKAAGTLTVDNVRAAATPYVNKHGIANASSDLVSCLKDATSGTCEKMSDCKDQATMIAAGEALLAAAAADKRYGQ